MLSLVSQILKFHVILRADKILISYTLIAPQTSWNKSGISLNLTRRKLLNFNVPRGNQI